VLVGNDYEFAMMAQKTGRTERELIESTPLTFLTRGAEGSTIYDSRTAGEPIHVPIASVREVVDPTGAGDAYLGGIAFGLARGLPLDVTGRIASLAAAYAIEHRGCQEHQYTTDAFIERYAATFGTALELA
jgi:adenosine kinase